MKVSISVGLALLLAGCGGNVVVDKAGTTSSDTGSTSGSTSTTGSVTVTSGSTTMTSVGCTAHTDCPAGVCVFSTGTCAPLCGDDFCPSCGPGMVCEFCATSSCPDCDNCISACTPVTPGRCDDDDLCPVGQVCIFEQLHCAPQCGLDLDCDDFSFCADCVTSSCCGCNDCVSACVGGE